MNEPDHARPSYIGPDWLRCTVGYTLAAPPPAGATEDRALKSSNLWERLLCVMLRAQAGEFGDVLSLLTVIEQGPTVHLRDCAVRVFAQAAPFQHLTRLAEVFKHPDPETRVEAVAVAPLTTDLRLTPALAQHRARLRRGLERDWTMGAISDLLEPDIEDPVASDSPLNNADYARLVEEMKRSVHQKCGRLTGVYHGQPIELRQLLDSMKDLVMEYAEDVYSANPGGFLHDRFSIIEAMTGWGFAGCLDEECSPVMPKVTHYLNSLHQAKILNRYRPGIRYFFGHEIP